MSTTMTTTNNHTTSENGKAAENGHAIQTHQRTFSPRFDIWENDEELILYGDLPGVEADDLEIKFENRRLMIHGKVNRRMEGVQFMQSEYAIGDFHRHFAIGESVNSEAIQAELHDGVLTIHLPKQEEAKPRRIKVTTS